MEKTVGGPGEELLHAGESRPGPAGARVVAQLIGGRESAVLKMQRQHGSHWERGSLRSYEESGTDEMKERMM